MQTKESRIHMRGFASMTLEKRKEYASRGGRIATMKGRAHQWSREEARVAGRKGGLVVSQDREHMSVIGTKGGRN